ncbi:hypothetical protein F5Y06DRAFT_298072 [Hypoxylon sp. FL0890]|nr:hypothetical protein F5Y06DRAFT_298072 [Hypoxylon sp. FL0890]
MVSLILIFFASIVLSYPTNNTGLGQAHLHNCSIYHSNATCNCTMSVSPSSQGNYSVGFVGQEENLTISHDVSAKKGNGGSGLIQKSQGATQRNFPTDVVVTAILCILMMVVVLSR